jgi:hypothetical protein
MNPANVPPWGTPWHGLVRNNTLTLPNGSTMLYRQPVSTTFTTGSTFNRPPDTYGITRRFAAGLPPVTSSAEDIASGREWRNEVTISGGRYQVYGTALDGWIYLAPDGGRWLVRCPNINEQDLRSLTAPLNIGLTFLRFGDLGAVAQSFSWNVSLPLQDLGDSGAGRLMIDSIKPNGSAAIICAHIRGFNTRRMVRESIGFLELSISGPASAPTITAVVIRNKAQTLPITPPPVAVRSYWNGSSYQDTEPTGTYTVVYSLEGDTAHSSEYLLALWYDAAGLLREVVQRAQGISTYAAPRPANPLVDNSASASFAGNLDLMVGGAVVDSIPFSAGITAGKSGTNGVYTFSGAVDGVSMTGNATVAPPFFVTNPFPDIGYVLPGFGSTAFQYAGFSASYILFISPDGTFFGPTATSLTLFTATVYPYWYSRQVVGFEISTENGAPDAASRRWRFRPPATPSGLASGVTIDTTTPTGPTFYGSHDPYSGASVWGQSTPVCYV